MLTLLIPARLALIALGAKPETIRLDQLLKNSSCIVDATYESDRVHSRGLVFASKGRRLKDQFVQLDIPMYRGDDVEAKISDLPRSALLFLTRQTLKGANRWKCETMILLPHGHAQGLSVEDIHTHRIIGWRIDEQVDFPAWLLPASTASHMFSAHATKAQLLTCIRKTLARSKKLHGWYVSADQ